MMQTNSMETNQPGEARYDRVSQTAVKVPVYCPNTSFPTVMSYAWHA